MFASATEKPIIIIHSSSLQLRERALRSLIAELLPNGEAEYGLTQYWAGEDRLDVIAEGITASSLLADTRLVVVRNWERLSAREQTQLLPALQNPPPGTMIVLLSAPRNDQERKKPPLAPEVAALAKKQGEIRVLEEPRERQIGDWIREEVRAQGKQIESEGIVALVQLVGPEIDRLANEIAKLILYVGEAPTITSADVHAVCSATEEGGIFDLVDAIGHRDAPKAVDIVRALLPAGTPRGAASPILAMISRQIRLLWQAVYLQKSGLSVSAMPEEIASLLPEETSLRAAHPFVKDKIAQQAQHFSEGQLARALVRIYEAELTLKGLGEGMADERTILESLIVTLCQK